MKTYHYLKIMDKTLLDKKKAFDWQSRTEGKTHPQKAFMPQMKTRMTERKKLGL